MSPISKTTFTDWHQEQMQNPDFVAAVNKLESWYQKTRRIQHIKSIFEGLLPSKVLTPFNLEIKPHKEK